MSTFAFVILFVGASIGVLIYFQKRTAYTRSFRRVNAVVRDGLSRVGLGDQPDVATLQRRVFRRMIESIPLGVAGTPLPPTGFIVKVSPEDAAQIETCRSWFCRELAEAFSEQAPAGSRFDEAVKVEIQKDLERPSGAPLVVADFSLATEWSLHEGPNTAPTCQALLRGTQATWQICDGFTLGRRDNCDAVIPNPKVSRHHLTFYRTSSGWELVDHDTKNGTVVDGRRVVGRTIIPGAATIEVARAECFELIDSDTIDGDLS